MKIIFNLKKVVVLFSLLLLSTAFGQTSKFKVTLDAGHGDHDPGARYNGHIEKLINLAIALKVGHILETYPDVNVIYTRTDDTFIGLIERANIANRAKSDIFVSIHCNANDREGAFGSQTFVMGLSKSKSSLEVSKKENAVITLEKDYKKKYEGYNPNKPESMIGVTLLQEEFIENSIVLAGKIQDKFRTNLARKDRGIGQEPFMVLHKASMPRVLVETGFISNIVEGEYLDSETGQQEIAQAIADAIISYKKDNFEPDDENNIIREPKSQPEPVKKTEIPNIKNKDTKTSNEIIYKIQLCASEKKIQLKSYNFKGLTDLSLSKEGKIYKYFYGRENDYNEIQKLLKRAKAKGYASSYIVAEKDGENISVNEALKQQ